MAIRVVLGLLTLLLVVLTWTGGLFLVQARIRNGECTQNTGLRSLSSPRCGVPQLPQWPRIAPWGEVCRSDPTGELRSWPIRHAIHTGRQRYAARSTDLQSCCRCDRGQVRDLPHADVARGGDRFGGGGVPCFRSSPGRVGCYPRSVEGVRLSGFGRGVVRPPVIRLIRKITLATICGAFPEASSFDRLRSWGDRADLRAVCGRERSRESHALGVGFRPAEGRHVQSVGVLRVVSHP